MRFFVIYKLITYFYCLGSIWKIELDESLSVCIEAINLYFQRRKFRFSVSNAFEMSQRTQTSLRRLQDVLKRSRHLMTKQEFVTSDRRRQIYDTLKMSDLCRLEGVQFTTSWRRLIYDVLKTSVKQCLYSNVVSISMQRRKIWVFIILYCLKYSENFESSCLS